MPAAGRPIPEPPITLVGIGAGGYSELPPQLARLVDGARVVLGGPRYLAMLPPIAGQERIAWPSPLRAGLPALLSSLDEGPVVALASGDPLVSGIGSTLIELLGAEHVTIHPAVSSVALARAALGWPAESCAVVSVVGREVAAVLRELAPGRRILVLSADRSTPGQVARLVTEAGYGRTRMTVLGDLGSPEASRGDGLAETWTGESPQLNIVALAVTGPHLLGWTAGLPDDVFEHDGQLTKRDLRASALARLAPAPGEHLWDVGAGAGSIGIEWMRAHPTCAATAVEADHDRAARIGRNAARLGVPGLCVVTGRAPEALAGLERPDAVFVGGGATVPGVLDTCLEALASGGRIVVHGVTLETEVLLAGAHRNHGGELVRIGVETAAPIGTFTGWTPARIVTQWSCQRP